MELAVKDTLRKRFFNALNSLASFFHKSSEVASPHKDIHPKKQVEKNRPNVSGDKKIKQDVGFTGSGYKAKGNVNKDAKIFNRLRRDDYKGHQH